MENIIELELKAVDFKDTDYRPNCDCAIAKAAKRQLNAFDVNEQVSGIFINNECYYHERYTLVDFQVDNNKATSAGFDNTTIRTITLTKA